MADMLRSPTFLVGTERQRNILDEFQRRDQHFSEEYSKNKPLCFSARAYQKTHPGKMRSGARDADATLASPMLLGVADGVSQLEEFGVDASMLPKELLRSCEYLAMSQLIPDKPVSPSDTYRGPVSLLKEAYEDTESMGSTTVLLAILDNSSRIHGKLHPMVAVLTVGDCELLILRRCEGRHNPLQAVFHTEMQRIDGHVQTPLQVARVDETVDPDFTEDQALEVIERGSAVHCVSAYEGDIIVLGSDGVFDNLFLDEIVDICNEELLPSNPGRFVPTQLTRLELIAKRIVEESHAKSVSIGGIKPDTPIGSGGKIDDTSVVVGEVVEWTQAHRKLWAKVQERRWSNMVTCGGLDHITCRTCIMPQDVDEDEADLSRGVSTSSSRDYMRRQSTGDSSDEDEDDHGKCVVT